MFGMSRAFVKESDQDTDPLPERPISEHPNLVTARGQSLIEARVRELEAERTIARAAGDASTLARVARDLRYFQVAARQRARGDAAGQYSAGALWCACAAAARRWQGAQLPAGG